MWPAAFSRTRRRIPPAVARATRPGWPGIRGSRDQMTDAEARLRGQGESTARAILREDAEAWGLFPGRLSAPSAGALPETPSHRPTEPAGGEAGDVSPAPPGPVGSKTAGGHPEGYHPDCQGKGRLPLSAKRQAATLRRENEHGGTANHAPPRRGHQGINCRNTSRTRTGEAEAPSGPALRHASSRSTTGSCCR